MSEKIKVVIKVRPLIEREKCKGAQEQWTVSNNSIYLTNCKSRDKDCYYFDYVFDQEKTNSDLFEAITKPIVDAAVRGFNGTVFAYGQTSSGKTHTMMGTQLEPGIIPQTINYIFQAIHSITSLEGRNFLLRASYMEIYNERIVDLLDGEERLKLQEIDGQIVISKLKEEVACTAEKILGLMKRGEKIRKTSQTNMNERSSRSHTIFRIIIESGLQEEEDGAVQVSHLNLVDLAGSERVDQTGAVGERLKEGCSINRSLFMLGHVISQLSEGQEHVSFRDSKLTRILQTSLGGNAHTAIICTVTPAVIDETISTLGFASRAANIKNKPLKNEVLTDAALLKRYARQIAKLQEELKKTKHSTKASEEIESKLEETQRHNQLLQQRIDLLQEKLIGFPLLDSNASAVRRALRRRTWGGHTTKPRFSVHLPQTLNPIEEEYECLEQQAGEVFSRSVADFQYGEFETPLEEFELELIEAERHRYSSESLSSNEDSLVTIRKKGKTVSFADQSESKDIECQTVAVRTENETFSSESECLYCNKCKVERSTSKEVDCQTDRCHSDSVEAAVNTSLELISDDTSCKQCNKSETRVICRTDMKDTDCQTEAAVCARLSDHFTMETPPKVLRERARYLEKEYDELLEFTKLEKQMICEEQLAALIRENDKLRRENQETRKTVTELESMYLDTNRALSLMQDENKQLKQKLENEVKKCSEISRNISTLNKIQEETNTKLKDSLALEKEMKILKQKLQTLENEKLDFEIAKQLQDEKYQRRISELSKSLEEAWKHNETVNKDGKDTVICEGCICLRKELETHKTQPIDGENVSTSVENRKMHILSMQDVHSAQKQESVASQNELEGRYSELNVILKEKEEKIELLQERLREAENNLEEVRKLTEDYSICVEQLKEKQETVFILQAQLSSNEIAMKEKLLTLMDDLKEREQQIAVLEEKLITTESEMQNIHILYAETLKGKDESLSSLRQQLAEREQHLEESKAKYLKLAENLKENEESTALLQRDLVQVQNEINEAAKIKQLHEECEFAIKENQQTITLLHEQLTNSEKSELDVTQKLSDAADALKKSQDSCTLFQEKLNNAENELKALVELKAEHAVLMEQLKQKEDVHMSLKEQLTNYQISLSEMEQSNILLMQSVKEKEDALSLLQNKLEHSNKEAAEIKEWHAMCAVALNEKEESLLYYKQKLAVNEIFIAETTEKVSKLSQACTEKEERIATLEKKLHEAETRKQLEKCSAHVETLKENELERAAVIEKEHSEEEKNEREIMLVALKEKDEYLSSLEENFAAHKILLEEIRQKCSTLTEALKEKEETIALLQTKLHESSLEVEEGKELKHIHSECLLKLKEKDELVLYLEEKLVANETSAVETMQKCSKLAMAFTDMEVRIDELEQKVYEAENNKEATGRHSVCIQALEEKDTSLIALLADQTLITDLTQKCSNLTETLKEKEEVIALLQEELYEFRSEAEGKEIHSECIQRLREKDELLLHLQEKLAANEKSALEATHNCSKLAEVFRGIEDRINNLKQKLYETENNNETTKSLSTCMQAVQEEDTSFLTLHENLIKNEMLLVDLTQKCVHLKEILKSKENTIALLEKKLQDSHSELDEKAAHSHCIQGLREKDELLSHLERQMITNEISAAETVQYCSRLAGALRGIEDNVNVLEQQLHEAENCEKQMERKLSVYADALKEKEDMIAFLEEKLRESQSYVGGEEIHLQCIQRLREKEELLSNLETKVIANEISATEIIKNCTVLAGALRGLNECVNALEQKLYKAENCNIEMNLEIEALKEKCNNMINEVALFTELKEVHAICTNVLKEKEELVSSLQELINRNKQQLHEAENCEKQMERKLSMYVDALKEKEEMIAFLEEKLHESQSNIGGEEIHSQYIQRLREKEELLSNLETKVIANEISATEIIKNCSVLAGALRGLNECVNVLEQKLYKAENCKIEMNLEIETLKEKCNNMINEVALFTELKEVHTICANALKEKEELVSSLQEEMINRNKHAAIVEEKLVKISREKEEILVFLQEAKTELEEKIIEIARLKEANETNTELLKQKTEDMLTLEQKLSRNEKFVRELEETQFNMANALKNKEASLILLQENINKAKEEIIEAAKLKEIHLTCTEAEKERELTVLLLKEKIADFEMQVKQMEEKHAMLTSNLKEKEEIITSLEEKHRVEESKTLEGKFICIKCIEKKENCFSLQEQHTCQEITEAAVQENALQEVLNEKEEFLQIDNDVFVMGLEENVMPLIGNLTNYKRAVNLQQEGPEETEDDRVQMIEVCDTSMKGEEVVLPLADQLINEEILSVEVEESCSALINNFKESLRSVNLLKENIDYFANEVGSTQLNMICIECSKIKEIDEILNTMKQKITCCEKEISEHKMKSAALIRHLSYTAKLLNEKESCLKAAEHRLHIAENKLTLLREAITTTSSESGSSMGATPPVQRHVALENDVTIVPDVLKLEWDALIRENQTLQDERNNYQSLYEGERRQELANLYQEELEEIQMSSSHASQSFTQNHPANTTCEVEQSYVSEKMLKEIENRKCNSFDSEAISNPISKSGSCSKTELETLQNENAALLKTYKELEERIKEYETTLKQMRSENVNLTSQLQNKTQDIYSLRKAMVNEISSLNPKLKPALQEYCLQKLLSTLLSSIMEKQKELHEQMEDRISYLNDKIAEKEKQHIDSDRRKDSWIKQLESEVEHLTKCLDVLDSRKEQVKQQDSNDMLAKLKEEKQVLLKKIQYLEQDVKSFQQQMNAEAETGKLKHEDFIYKIDRLESSIISKDKIITKLEEDVETKSRKEHQLLVKLENEIKKSNTLECKLKAMERKLNDLEQIKLTLLQQLECKCKEESEQKDILNSECERNKMLASQIMQLQTHLENISQKNEFLTVQKVKLEQHLEEEQHKNSTLLSEMEDMKQEIYYLKQEAINKDVAFKQEKLALEEEQQKNSTLLSEMEEMKQEIYFLKQEVINKDAAFKQEKQALEEEQQKSSTLLLKIEVMKEEMDHLQQLELNRNNTFKQEKLKFQKEIHKLECSAKIYKAENVENMKQRNAVIKQLEQEIERKQHMLEKEIKTVSELQLNIKDLEKQVSCLVSTNSALAEEVKHKDEVEQKFKHKLNMEMQKVQTLASHLAQITAEKEDKIRRNEELIKKNMRLELQNDLLQKRKTQLQSLLDNLVKEFETLKEEVIARKATMVKVYTVGQPCERREQAQREKSTDLMPVEQQEFIFNFKEGIREIREYLSQTDTYWEGLENIRRENNILYEEHKTCKAALEAGKCKIEQLEKEISKEFVSRDEVKQMSEANKETATRLERTVHQLCKAEKEREHYKKSLQHEQEERRLVTQELQQLKSKHESCKSKNSVLYNHARELQIRLEELRDRNEHLELESNGAAHRIAQLQEEIKELKDAKAAAEEKCHCKALTEEVNQLRNQASEKSAWEQRCKAEIRQCQKFEKDNKLYKEKISELKAELHKIRADEQKVCKSKLVDAGIQVDEMKPWKGTSGVPYEDLMRDYKIQEKKIEKYKEVCRYRMQKIRNLEQKVEKLEESNAVLQGQSGVQSGDKMADKENQEDVAFNRPLTENAIAYSLHSTPQKK